MNAKSNSTASSLFGVTIAGVQPDDGPPMQTKSDDLSVSENKRCHKCGATKSLSAFSRNKAAKDGLQNVCKTCSNAIHKIWHASNQKRCNAISRAWRAANPDKVNAQNRKWRAANPEKCLAKHRRWCTANPSKMKAYREKWRRANSKRQKECEQKYRKTNAERIKTRQRKWVSSSINHVRRYFRTKAACRRALKRAASGAKYTTAGLIEARWEMFGNKCWIFRTKTYRV